MIEAHLEDLLRLLALAVSAALFGCGGVDFSGQYGGGVVATLSQCTDGTTGSQSLPLSWVVADSGDAITIAFNGVCSPWTGRAAGGTIALNAKTCPDQVDTGTTISLALADGAVSLRDRVLTLDMHMLETVADSSGSATCHVSLAGGLVAQ